MSKPTKEHDEDRLSRLRGEEYARDNVDEFEEKHAGSMLALIATYRDDDAQFLLDHLRALFWSDKWRDGGSDDDR